ncbi:MAG: HAD family hydrolase [Acidimicrobiia bacterium]|nr:HAD family hydrolase [Acidimicrobiia bacterium]
MTPIDAVLFDLDDTLFDQRLWLEGAWRSVAAVASTRYGVDRVQLLDALLAVAAEGSDGGRIIDGALARMGVTGVPTIPLVDVFRAHRPPLLLPYPGVGMALSLLKARIPLGLVTDGDPRIQSAKLSALGLGDAFRVVVFSDELAPARAARKPDPAPFLRAASVLGVSPRATVFVGDRPDKDVVGGHAAGMRVIRVRTGEYKHLESRDQPWHDVPSAVSAVAILEDELRRSQPSDDPPSRILRVDVGPIDPTSTLRMHEDVDRGVR